jgi:hypothetical protein
LISFILRSALGAATSCEVTVTVASGADAVADAAARSGGRFACAGGVESESDFQHDAKQRV